LAIDDRRLHWFDLSDDHELEIPGDGIARMIGFPGLWIDSGGLPDNDSVRTVTTLEQGLTSAEHAAFVSTLEQSRRGHEAK
jgi:hypothetical protein